MPKLTRLLVIAAVAALSAWGTGARADSPSNRKPVQACLDLAARLQPADLNEPKLYGVISFYYRVLLAESEEGVPSHPKLDPLFGAKIVARVREACGRDADRSFRFLSHALATTGDLDGAIEAGQARAALLPGADADELAVLWLRKGDEGRALELFRRGRRVRPASDHKLLAEAYSRLAFDLGFSLERRPDALAKAADLQRQVVSASPGDWAETHRLAVTLNRLADASRTPDGLPIAHSALQEAAGLIEAALSGSGPALQRFEQVEAKDTLADVYVTLAEISALRNNKGATVAAAEKVAGLVVGETYAGFGTGIHGQIAADRWSDDPTLTPVAERFRKLGDALLRVQALEQALDVFKAEAAILDASAKASGEGPVGGETLTQVATIKRLLGDLTGARATIEDNLTRMRRNVIAQQGAYDLDSGFLRVETAAALVERALILAASGQSAPACADLRQADGIFRPYPPNFQEGVRVAAEIARNLGDLCPAGSAR